MVQGWLGPWPYRPLGMEWHRPEVALISLSCAFIPPNTAPKLDAMGIRSEDRRDEGWSEAMAAGWDTDEAARGVETGSERGVLC